MNRYLVEMQLAPQAFAAFVKNPGDRFQANAAVVEAVGGKFIEYWFGVGSNTVHLVVEMPDGTRMEALVMSVLAGGVVTSVKSVQILTASEAVAAMEMAGGAGYRAPETK
ncbi:MAG: GYD domain-containing protein [Caldilineaceae bacterium]